MIHFEKCTKPFNANDFQCGVIDAQDSQNNNFRILNGIPLNIKGKNKSQDGFGVNVLEALKNAEVTFNQDDQLLALYMITYIKPQPQQKKSKKQEDIILGSHVALVFIAGNQVALIDPQKYKSKNSKFVFISPKENDTNLTDNNTKKRSFLFPFNEMYQYKGLYFPENINDKENKYLRQTIKYTLRQNINAFRFFTFLQKIPPQFTLRELLQNQKVTFSMLLDDFRKYNKTPRVIALIKVLETLNHEHNNSSLESKISTYMAAAIHIFQNTRSILEIKTDYLNDHRWAGLKATLHKEKETIDLRSIIKDFKQNYITLYSINSDINQELKSKLECEIKKKLTYFENVTSYLYYAVTVFDMKLLLHHSSKDLQWHDSHIISPSFGYSYRLAEKYTGRGFTRQDPLNVLTNHILLPQKLNLIQSDLPLIYLDREYIKENCVELEDFKNEIHQVLICVFSIFSQCLLQKWSL